MSMLDNLLEWFPDEELLKADGLDDAIIGIDVNSMRLIYSKNKCVDIFMQRDGMTDEEANEFFEYNVHSAWVGDKTPIFCTDDV